MELTLVQRRLLAVAVAVVAAVVLGLRLLGHESTPARKYVPVRPAAAAAAQPRAVVVDVVGAVKRPGLYHLATGARVVDAVAAAGGVTRRADRVGVNLAAPVSDGQQVLVPVRGAVGAAGASTSATGPVSLSAATPEQLDALPGIGPTTAAKIVAYRQEHGAFHSVEELDAVPGIGPGRMAELKGLVVP
jgi:competence protein ComEA